MVTPDRGLEMKPQLAIFSAGGQVSLDWAPRFAEAGCYVVDNSSAWRMDPTKKLVIPEINADVLTPEDRIIANPNCSTIQMLMALAPIYRTYGIRRVVVSTYQAITGTGMRAVTQMENERNGVMDGPMIYPHVIDRNCIPQCDSFTENGYTKEEMKLVNETHKIFGDESILVSPTAIRVPVVGAIPSRSTSRRNATSRSKRSASFSTGRRGSRWWTVRSGRSIRWRSTHSITTKSLWVGCGAISRTRGR